VREYLPQAETMAQSVMAEARETQQTALGQIDAIDGRHVMGRTKYNADQWDWLEQIHPDERARLNSGWVSRSNTIGLDEVAEAARMRLGGVDHLKDADVIERTWLRWNRQADAAGAVARGRTPVASRYSSRIDLDDILPNKAALGYDTKALIELRGADLAGYLAQHDAARFADEALAVLEDVAAPRLGEPAFRMGYQTWEAEVENLRYAIRNGDALADDFARYAELLPTQVEDVAHSLEDAYSLTISLSRQAGLSVADWATIPWEV
jgi:hypothetical protein